ncbi:MAG: maleylpyruvate isomerase family mycothiol-dependent enzyme [Ilumatobacteraceae bacterium]
MEDDQYLDSLRAESAALLAAAHRAGRDAAVPGCPGWTTEDLVWHIGEVHDFWGTVVAERMTDPRSYQEPERPTGSEEVRQFAEASAARLIDALERTDVSTPVWTWTSRQDVGFVRRRMAHETAVHRVDAERAAGGEHRLDPALAADGIDEFLAHFRLRVGDDAPTVDGSVHLHCTDVEGEWVVRDDVVTREHAKGDAAIRGSAHDVLMVLWRRQPLDSVDVVGDGAVAERFVARPNLR